jgi:RNA polymerase sigma factor (sigma-70 family)
MTDVDPIPALVEHAAHGDQEAWSELVTRFSPLLVGVIRRFRLSPAEADDVAQTVWLRLVEHLGQLREPRALPMWIVTTARREALRQLAGLRRDTLWDPLSAPPPGSSTDDDVDGGLLRQERHEALLAGLAELPDRHRRLLLLLVQDPPLSYGEISRRIGVPLGSIGPTRSRALDRLRRTPSIRAFLTAGDPSAPGPNAPGPSAPDPTAPGPSTPGARRSSARDSSSRVGSAAEEAS